MCASFFSSRLSRLSRLQGFKALNLNHFWTNFEPTLNQLEPTLNLNLSRLSRLQGFELEPSFAGHISSYRCARNFDIVKLKFFFTSLPCRLITHILTAFSITFLIHLKKDGHTLLGLSSKVFYFRSLVHLYHSDFSQQFNNFFD